MPFALSLHAGDPARLSTPLLAIELPSDKPVPRTLAPLDKALGGALTRAVKQKDFKGNRDETLLLFAHGKGPQRVLLVGLGPSPGPGAIVRVASRAGRKGNSMGIERMGFWAEGLEGTAIENAAIGLSLGGWEYTELRTQPPASERPKPLITAVVCIDSSKGGAGADRK